MKEILTIYNYVDGQNDVPFYDSDKPIKITEYSFSSQRMSSSSITASFSCPFVLDDLWDGNQYVVFRGLKYFLKNKPTSSKDNTDARYNYNVEFIPKRELQLANVYFYDAVTEDAATDDKYKSNSTKVIFYGTINEFAARLQASLKYCGLTGYTVIVDEGVVSEAKQVSFEDKTFFEALQESYDQWGVPFYFVGENEIHFGDASTEIATVFKYGIKNSLLSVKKENADYQIVNRCSATGSTDNIPYYYPNNSPKGNIEAKVLSSNSKLAQDDILVKDYEKFSANVETTDTVVWRTAAVSSHTIQVNNEGQYSGQERSVSIVNMQPVIDRFVVNFTVASEGRIIISTDMVRNLMDIGSALSAGVITDYGLVSVDSPLSYVTVSDNGDGTLVTSWLEKGNYTLILVYTLAHVGVNEYTYSTNITLSGKAEWSRQRDGESTAIDLADIGISVDVVPSNGDGFVQNLINKITPSSSLLPPIYRETLGAERFYNAKNNTYTDPETGEFYQFENEYTTNNPREYITEDEDIKPTIKGITNAAGQEIGRFLEVAYDANDSDETDEEGNYLHPYFFVKLPKFDGPWGFNLFDHAIENGEMTLAMTSGNCGACQFTIGVSDDDMQKNIVQVDDNGDLVRDSDGNVSLGQWQERQNDTENYEVWIALKKEESTFGVIMPNVENNYKPQAGDSFVILHISLPQTYIDKAEQDLEDFIIRYMADNNSDKFDFSIEFSRIYIAEHPDIAAALDENSKVKVEYNGKTYSFFVSQYTYKANDDESLPEIKVELSDTISIDKGVLEQTVAGIELSVGKQVSNIDFLGYGRNYFLGKNYNDTANGLITFLRGLVVGEPRNGCGFAPSGKEVTGVLNSLELKGTSNKAALSITHGHIEGFRTGLRRIIGDATLETTDYLVLVENPNDSTIKLPSDPEDGQSYRIHNAGYSQVILDGNGKFITRSGNSTETQTVDKGETAMIEIFYSSVVRQWYMSYSTDSFFARDENGDVYVKNGRGLYTESFMSAHGKDSVAGGGSGSGGLDVDALWNILGASTTEQINVSHIPSLSISKITGLQGELDSKLEGITKEMVEAVLTGTITSHNHNGQYAPLSGGIIPSQYLPSFVDDVLEYASKSAFPASGESGKIYVAVDTNLTYRWSGSTYTEISPSLALGHTSSTAYPGDEGLANTQAIATLQGYFTDGAAKKVANALTINHDGGSTSASAKTYNGSAAVTVNIPTTLPASDVYDWAKQPEKPSYNFSEIGNKPTTLEGYGITDGVNDVKASDNLAGSINGHSLAISVKDGYAIPSNAQINLWDKICALFGVDTDGNVYVTNNKGFYSNSFISAKGSDPEAGGGSSSGSINEDDLWKILATAGAEKIDASHIPSLSALSGQLTNAQLAYDSIAVAGVTVALGGAVTTKQIAGALIAAGYKLTDTVYTLPKATASVLGGIKVAAVRTSAITTAHGGTTSDRYYGIELDSDGKAFVNVPWVNTTYTLASLGITATAAELNKLDGLATTATELGYLHGVTSSVQTQLDARMKVGTVGYDTAYLKSITMNGGGYSFLGATATAMPAFYAPIEKGTSGQILKSNGGGAPSWVNQTDIEAGTLHTYYIGSSSLNEIKTPGQLYYSGGNNSVTGKPSGVDAFGVLSIRTATGWYGQLLMSSNQATGIYWRTQSTYTDDGWRKILDSKNYTDYTVTKTGSGASGTWPISISGNSDTVDNWHGVGASGNVLKKSGYSGSDTADLSSYWCRLASVNHTWWMDDSDITLYLHSAYQKKWGIVCIRSRKNSEGSITVACQILAGNLDTSCVRLYYDASSLDTKTELWYNVVARYGVINALVLSETSRTAQEKNLVVLYTTDFTEAQTLPDMPYIEAEYMIIGNSISGNAATATKLGTNTIGGTAQGIYLNGGTATALSATVGTATRPVYMKDGVITAGTYTFGNASGNAALNNGTLNTNLNADELDGHHSTYFRMDYLTDWDDTYEGIALRFASSGITGDTPYSLIGGNQATVIQVIPGNTNQYSAQLAIGFNYNRLAWRKRKTNDDGTYGWDSWQLVSAGSLVYTRTLWGQPFDGTQNVIGSLSSVANIAMSGYISGVTNITMTGRIRLDTTGDGQVISLHKSNMAAGETIFMSLGQSATTKNHASVGFVYTDNGSNENRLSFSLYSVNNILNICGSGNVGIGTTTPSYKLDVAGKGRFSDTLAVAGLSSKYIELSYGSPFIDFHYSNSSEDYTNRIVEGLSGQLTITGKLRVGLDSHTSTNYNFHVAGTGYFSNSLSLASTLTAQGLATLNGGIKTNTITLVNGSKTASISLDADGYIHATAGLYSDGFLSSKGKDSEAGTVAEETTYLPEITISKLPKGQNVTLAQLSAVGFTSTVIADIQAGKVTHIKATYLLGDVEIWPVQGAGKNFFIVGYECQSPSYMDMMEWYEVSNLENDGQIVAEFFER